MQLPLESQLENVAYAFIHKSKVNLFTKMGFSGCSCSNWRSQKDHLGIYEGYYDYYILSLIGSYLSAITIGISIGKCCICLYTQKRS